MLDFIFCEGRALSFMFGVAISPTQFRARSLCYLTILFVFSITTLSYSQQFILGNTQIQTSRGSAASGVAKAFPVTAAVSAPVTNLSVFLDSSNTAATVWVGLYSHYNGNPSKLLSHAAILHPASGRWNNITIPSVQVTKGARYWVALLGLNGQIEFRDRTSTCYSETSQQRTLTALPATWTMGSRLSTCIVSMFGSGSPLSTVSVKVSPATASLQVGQHTQFTATVSGTTNTAVTWKASGGTVTTTGYYTAPSSAGTYTVTAASVASSTKTASAVVTVSQSGQVSISVSPATANVPVGGRQQFSALVSGTSNTAVTWSASGGTITTSGMYTAPTRAGTYTVKATSVAAPTWSGLASVAVSHSVSLKWSPSSSAGISYYKVYRGNISGGPYTLLKSGITAMSFIDSSVQSGSTYYYVTTAVNSSGKESAYSGVAKAVIPTP
jgi:hypothetical protein